MNPEEFLVQSDVDALGKVLEELAIKVHNGDERRNMLLAAGIKSAFFGNFNLNALPLPFAQSLLGKFVSYRIADRDPEYHPMLKLLEYLAKVDAYEWGEQEKELFLRLIERGQQNFKALAARKVVGRIESPLGTPIGTGVLVEKNLLLTCNHVFSKNNVQQAWIRFDCSAGKLLLPEALELDQEPVSSQDNPDYALIRIKGTPKHSPVVLDDTSPEALSSGQHIRIIHYPQGEYAVVSDVGHIVQLGKEYIDHDLKANNGSSGAPIFNLGWQVVALHRGDPGIGRFVQPGTTSGVRISSFRLKISPYLS
jgi:S1-C subfamily serine protease